MNDSTGPFVLCLAVIGIAASVIALSFLFNVGSNVADKVYPREEPDHGATAWGYMQRLNAVNTDCHKAPNGYACAVILSTGPSRFVLCSDGQCEEILPQ